MPRPPGFIPSPDGGAGPERRAPLPSRKKPSKAPEGGGATGPVASTGGRPDHATGPRSVSGARAAAGSAARPDAPSPSRGDGEEAVRTEMWTLIGTERTEIDESVGTDDETGPSAAAPSPVPDTSWADFPLPGEGTSGRTQTGHSRKSDGVSPLAGGELPVLVPPGPGTPKTPLSRRKRLAIVVSAGVAAAVLITVPLLMVNGGSDTNAAAVDVGASVSELPTDGMSFGDAGPSPRESAPARSGKPARSNSPAETHTPSSNTPGKRRQDKETDKPRHAPAAPPSHEQQPTAKPPAQPPRVPPHR